MSNSKTSGLIEKNNWLKNNTVNYVIQGSWWPVCYLSDIDQVLNVQEYVGITDAESTCSFFCIRADLPRLLEAVTSYRVSRK